MCLEMMILIMTREASRREHVGIPSLNMSARETLVFVFFFSVGFRRLEDIKDVYGRAS